jgi:hypothetical protein
MALNVGDILDHIVSHAMTTGYFERVNQHEAKNAPGNGLTAAVWVRTIRPKRSGLDKTSVKVTFTVRLYSNMVAEPQDAIDPDLMKATDALMALYTGDFSFDGTVYAVDLLGEEGEPLQGDAGYVEIDKKMFRIFDITLPVMVDDVWTQTA